MGVLLVLVEGFRGLFPPLRLFSGTAPTSSTCVGFSQLRIKARLGSGLRRAEGVRLGQQLATLAGLLGSGSGPF